jgi:hypothetical protein
VEVSHGKIRVRPYGTPVISGVSNPVFGEISGSGQPASLTSPWGLSMDYKLENNTYKE